MKKSGMVLALMALLIFIMPTNAVIADDMQGNTPFNRHTGLYAEANLGKTLVWHPDFFGNDFASGGFFGYGFSIGGGYMFKHWLGAEAGYIHIKPEFAGIEAEGNLYGFYLTSRFNIPIKDRFSIIFKLGATTISATSDEVTTEVAPFAGIGFGYALTEKIDLRAQFQGPNLLMWGAGVISGGLAYHF